MASRSWNRIELIGNLTRDPELRYTPSGSAVVTFGMATNRYYTTADGEKREETDFHRLVAWNKLAEICNQFLKKGMKVFISGRLQYREWESQDGQKRRDAEITVEDMIILTPKTNGEAVVVSERAEEQKQKAVKEESEEVKKSPPKDSPQEEVKDDLPF